MRHPVQPQRLQAWRSLAATTTFAAMLIAVACAAPASDDSAVRLPISVPVQLRQSVEVPPDPAPQPMAMPQQPQPPQPTLPGGKLPQYQLGHHQRRVDGASDPADSRLRLLLALPTQPIVLDIDITIDNQPFRNLRESRAADLLIAATTASPASDNRDVEPPASNEEPVNSETLPEAPDENRSAGEEATDSSDEAEPSQNDEEAEANVPTVTPPSVPEYVPATTAEQKLRRYVAAAGTEVSLDEVRWLLCNWVDGPRVLLLNENFQRFRAGQRPVFEILDRDGDDTVSAAELEQALASVQSCDLNRDDIVDALELSRVAADPRRQIAARPPRGAALVQLPDADSATMAYEQLACRYSVDADAKSSPPGGALVPRFDVNANGRFDPEELEQLQQREADLHLAVAFDTRKPDESTLSLRGIAVDAASPVVAEATVDGGSIVVQIDRTSVSFSAIQQSASDQVSVGAVADGYPLLPEIDPNDDGRLTIRELRELNQRLQAFDHNRDGQLTADEAQAPIRVGIGLGPLVHQVLAGIRSIPRAALPPTVSGPDWFVRMDRNKDNDLARGEFPGTDEQFADLDADGDQLISAQEALDYDANAAPAADNTSDGESSPATESNQ